MESLLAWLTGTIVPGTPTVNPRDYGSDACIKALLRCGTLPANLDPSLARSELSPSTICLCDAVFLRVGRIARDCLINSAAHQSRQSWERLAASCYSTYSHEQHTSPTLKRNSRILARSVFVREEDSGDAKHWPLLAKIVPVIIGVGVLLLCAMAFLLYRRRQKSTNSSQVSFEGTRIRGPRTFFGLLPSTRQVRATRRTSTWDIDNSSNGHGDSYGEPEEHFSLTGNSRSSRGHVRLASEPLDIALPGHAPSSGTERSNPNNDFWPKLLQTNTVRNIRAIRPPWRHQPVVVRSVPPRRGFRVAETDVSTTAASSAGVTFEGAFTEGSTSWKGGSSTNGRGTLDYFSDENDKADTDESELEEFEVYGQGPETTISNPSAVGTDDSVLLISRIPGHTHSNSTQSHHVNIIPPSPATSQPPSPNDSRQPPPKLTPSTQRKNKQARFPPVPRGPPPVPTTSPWRSESILKHAVSEKSLSGSKGSSTAPSLLFGHSHPNPTTQTNTVASLVSPPPSPPRVPRHQLSSEAIRQQLRRPTAADGDLVASSTAPYFRSANPSTDSFRRAPSPVYHNNSQPIPLAASSSQPSGTSSRQHRPAPDTSDSAFLFPTSVRSAGYMSARNVSSDSVQSGQAWYPPAPPGVEY